MASYGFPQNNPGQLVTGLPPFFLGENTNPLSNNGFRSFISMDYGCRAWIKNLITQVNVNGLTTYQAFLQAYNQTPAGSPAYNPDYITDICNAAGVQPTDTIDTSDTGLTTLFFAQMPYELDSGESVDATSFANGLTLYHNPAQAITGTTGAGATPIPSALPDTNTWLTIILVGVIGLIVIGYFLMR